MRVDMNDFKSYLLNEQQEYLAQKIGDILSALQSLSEDSQNLGSRQLVRAADNVVNQMRRVLNGRWSRQEAKYLKQVQKSAVALAKAVDTNENLPEIISGVASALEKLLNGLGFPLNKIGAE